MNRRNENRKWICFSIFILITIVYCTIEIWKNQQTIIENQARIIEKMDALDLESTKWQSAIFKNIIENQNTAINMHVNNIRTLAGIREGLCEPWEAE